MADKFKMEVDYRQTLKNIDLSNKKRRRELKRVVTQTSKSIESNMANIISREATDSGRLANSVKAKRTNPKAYRPIPKEERGLFKSVHTRNRQARHWTFTDSGTRVRKGFRWVRIGGSWVFVRSKGSIRAVNFRERARATESLPFNRKVLAVANKNEQI